MALDGSAIGGIATAGAGFLGSILNGIFQSNAVERQTQLYYDNKEWQTQMHTLQTQINREDANLAYERQRALLNDQRQYDLPVNQVQRLQDAGLNPISFMGNGSASGSGISASSVPSASSASQPVVNPPTINPINIGDLGQIAANAFRVANESKMADAEVLKNLSTVDQIRAQTQAIMDGNYRANEMLPLTMYENALRIDKLGTDNVQAKELIRFNRIAAYSQLMSTQKQYFETLNGIFDIEQKRFGNDIQRAGVMLQAQRIQSEVSKMSVDALCNYASQFGVNRSGVKSNSYQYNRGSSHGVSDNTNASLGLNGNISKSPVGQSGALGALFNFGADYTKTDNQNVNENASETGSVSFSYKELDESFLKPASVSMQILYHLTQNPTNVRLLEAAKNMKDYMSGNAQLIVKNIMRLQGEIETMSNSITNPVESNIPFNSDSYSPQ